MTGIRLGSAKVALALLCVIPASCSQESPSRIPTTLRIGVLPDQGSDTLKARYTPLVDYLSERMGMTAELIIPKNYQEFVRTFGSGKFDLAYFGGLTFLQAERVYGAVPLVLRDIDRHFQSYYLIRADLKAQRLEECAGLRFAFGSKHSTSGFLMPKYFMKERGIDAASFFSKLTYSDNHELTAKLIRDGEADLGAANKRIIEGLYRSGTIDESQVRILEESPQYPDNVWAVPEDLDHTFRGRLRAAFLDLLPGNRQNEIILSRLEANHYLPTIHEDFRTLRAAIKDLDEENLLR